SVAKRAGFEDLEFAIQSGVFPGQRKAEFHKINSRSREGGEQSEIPEHASQGIKIRGRRTGGRGIGGNCGRWLPGRWGRIW
ncbi:MAG: hypothetical protein ACK53Y_12530, partial [bacterium]